MNFLNHLCEIGCWATCCSTNIVLGNSYLQVPMCLFVLHREPHWCICCRNPSFGLATKAKELQRCGSRGGPGVKSHTPGSIGKCEGVNPHTPKATPTLRDGVPVDSRNFRERFEGSKLNGLWRSLYHWKALGT